MSRAAFAARASSIRGPAREPDGTADPIQHCLWTISSFDDAKSVLAAAAAQVPADPGATSTDCGSKVAAATARGAALRHLWMWGCHTPRRAAYRRVAGQALGRRSVRSIEFSLQSQAAALLDSGVGPHIDLVADFARPLIRNALMQLLGVPEALRGPLQRQVAAMSPFIPGVRSAGTSQYFAVAAAAALLQQVWREELPPEAAAGRAFVDAVGRGELLLDEALAQATLLLFGNSYTTLDALTGLLARLIERPELWSGARSRSIAVPDLIEEGLRLGPPTHLVLYRRAEAEVRCPSFTIPAGATVAIPLDRINRDPAAFRQPDEFVPDRSDPPHLAFGAGIHTCVGLHLARAVLRIGLEALLRDLPEWPPETDRAAGPSLLGGESITHLRIPRSALARC